MAHMFKSVLVMVDVGNRFENVKFGRFAIVFLVVLFVNDGRRHEDALYSYKFQSTPRFSFSPP